MESGLRIVLRDPEISQSENDGRPRRRDPTVCKVNLIVGRERQVIHVEEKLLKHVPFILQRTSTVATFSLPHLVPNAVNTVLDFMWSGNVDRVATNEEIRQIILVCVEFGLDELKSQCIDILQRRLTPESADEVKKIGVSVRSAKLLRAVDNFVGSARNKLLSQVGLEDMSFAEIDSGLRTCKEKEYQWKLLLSVVKWVKHKETQRKHLLFNLVKYIHLDDVFEISPETFHKEFREGSILYNDLQCLQLSHRVLMGKVANGNESVRSGHSRLARTNSQVSLASTTTVETQIAESQDLANQRQRQFPKQTAVRSCGPVPIPIRLRTKRSKQSAPHKDLTNQIPASTRSSMTHHIKLMYQCSGSGTMYSYLKMYDFEKKVSSVQHVLKYPRSLSSMIATSTNVFHIGGVAGISNDGVKTVELFERNFRTSLPFPELLEYRKECAVCILDNHLFAIGGCQGEDAINCVESIKLTEEVLNSPHKGEWKNGMDFLNQPRGDLAAEVLNNKIFAVGGMGGIGMSLKIVEVYDSIADNWSDAPSMNEERCSFRVATLNGKIYAAGGENTAGKVFRETESYDPRTNKWVRSAEMHRPRKGLALIESNGFLYAIGGNVRGEKDLEYYDPVADRWTLMSWPDGLDQDGEFSSAIAVPD